jgi:NADH-quinone oxidoreductase subunit M
LDCGRVRDGDFRSSSRGASVTNMNSPLLHLLIECGLFTVILLALGDRRRELVRGLALLFGGIVFGTTAALLYNIIEAGGGISYEMNQSWISTPDIHFHIAADSISAWLIALTGLLTPIAVLLSWNQIQRKENIFYAMIFLLTLALVGVFAAQDLFLFYVFYELTLVPMILMIGIWGGERRIYASVKFFCYTLAASILMLASILYLYSAAGTGQISVLQSVLESGDLILSPSLSNLAFLGFFIAFAAKLALVPLHSWLPDAYDESPAAAPMLMSAVLMKMGTYGLLRIAIPLFPAYAHRHGNWIVALAIISIIYGALVAMVQPNMRRLVGFSSISHVGFIVLGLFTFTQAGIDGAVFQMVAHGISTGAIFLILGFVFERRRSMEIVDFGGLVHTSPALSATFLVAGFASVGLPGLCNFVGEYLVLQGAAQVYFWWAVLAAVGVILSACYFLWMYQRVFFGLRPNKSAAFTDLNLREWIAVAPLLILIVYLGVRANVLIDSIQPATARILELSRTGDLIKVKHQAVGEIRNAD